MGASQRLRRTRRQVEGESCIDAGAVKAYAHDLKDWFVSLACCGLDWQEVRLEDVGELLTSWQPAGRRGASWRPFLHHVSKSQPAARRVIGLKVPRKHPRILSVVDVQTILDACDRLRDRLLFAVLHDTGMRIGEALGLRHDDWAAAERTVAVAGADHRYRCSR